MALPVPSCSHRSPPETHYFLPVNCFPADTQALASHCLQVQIKWTFPGHSGPSLNPLLHNPPMSGHSLGQTGFPEHTCLLSSPRSPEPCKLSIHFQFISHRPPTLRSQESHVLGIPGSQTTANFGDGPGYDSCLRHLKQCGFKLLTVSVSSSLMKA